MLAPPVSAQKTGDYVVIWSDSEKGREEARALMRRNGCKGIRFERLDGNRVQIHGYLSQTGEPLNG